MINMKLTPAALNWLGSAFENKTKISPLATAPPDGFDQRALDDLIEQGVVRADKMMTTEAYALLDILAGATSFASVHLAGGTGHVNRVTYWRGDKVVSLDNNGTVFSVTPGNNIEGIEAIFKEITGSNRLVSSDFSVTLDFRSALVFAGLFDLSRQASIRAYADGTPVPPGFSAAAVSQFIDKAEASRWLTSHIKALNVPGLTAPPAETETSLNNLAEAGVIASNGDKYSVAYDSAQLATNFLFLENSVHFRAGAEKDGKLSTIECMYLQAGVHDVIMVDVAADRMDISSISSFAMIDNIKQMMTTTPSL